jgi:hypothetical protein
VSPPITQKLGDKFPQQGKGRHIDPRIGIRLQNTPKAGDKNVEGNHTGSLKNNVTEKETIPMTAHHNNNETAETVTEKTAAKADKKVSEADVMNFLGAKAVDVMNSLQEAAKATEKAANKANDLLDRPAPKNRDRIAYVAGGAAAGAIVGGAAGIGAVVAFPDSPDSPAMNGEKILGFGFGSFVGSLVGAATGALLSRRAIKADEKK